MTALCRSCSNTRQAEQEVGQYENCDAISEHLNSLAIGDNVRRTMHKLVDFQPMHSKIIIF